MKKITISNNFQIDLYTPKELKFYLDEYIIGQDSAKKILSVAAYNHYKRLYLNSSTSLSSTISKSNLLISGPTGCGKTMLVKTIANCLGVPYYIADATSLTQAGYVGDDVESVLSGLLRMCNYDIDKAQCGIVFIDEIDKLAKRGSGTSLTRDVGGEGVQQALLKMVEGSIVGVPPQEGRKHPEQPLLYIDTSNILFIVSGAFSGIEEIIKKRVSPNQSLGYTSFLFSTDRIDFDKEEVYDYLSHDDLRNYGFIPEFIGRFPILANVTQLTKDDLVKIITEPKDNILDQYATLLAFDDITLNITDKAIETIAESTLDLGTGARGLKSIMEAVMHDYMYDLPGSGVKEITITPKDVRNKLSKRFSNIKSSKKTNKF